MSSIEENDKLLTFKSLFDPIEPGYDEQWYKLLSIHVFLMKDSNLFYCRIIRNISSFKIPLWISNHKNVYILVWGSPFSCMAKKARGRARAACLLSTSGLYWEMAARVRPQDDLTVSSSVWKNIYKTNYPKAHSNWCSLFQFFLYFKYMYHLDISWNMCTFIATL